MQRYEPDAPDTRVLVQRAAAGDAVAFTELYVAFFGPVYRYLAAALGDREEADDAAQLVFLNVYEAIARFEDRGGSFRSFLFRVARNVAIDSRRAHSRQVTTDPHEVTRQLDAVAAWAGAATSRLDESGGMRALIAALPPAQQRVIGLRYVCEMTPAEIGDVMGSSADSVRHIQQRALRTLAAGLAAA